MYRLTFSPDAQKDLALLKKDEPASFKKTIRLLDEIVLHPTIGTGHPEQLKGKPENRWSRRITKKHRIVYQIFEAEIHVDILSSYGHYDDK